MYRNTLWILGLFFLGHAACLDRPEGPLHVPGVPYGPNPPTTPTTPMTPQTKAAAKPLIGGTLHVSSDDQYAIAADPDRDVIWVFDLREGKLVRSIPLKAGDTPGRVVEGAGRFHTILRQGGALFSFTAEGAFLERRTVCPLPRGVTYDPKGDRLIVTCQSGEIVSMPPTGNEGTKTLYLDRDLRDVVIGGDQIYVSRFKSAELITLNADLREIQRTVPATVTAMEKTMTGFEEVHNRPAVAYRLGTTPGGKLGMLHQQANDRTISIKTPGGYSSSGCGGLVRSVFSVFASGADSPKAAELGMAIVPLDAALSPDGTTLAVASPGNLGALVAVQRFTVSNLVPPNACERGRGVTLSNPQAVITSVAYTQSGQLLMFARDGAVLYRDGMPAIQPNAERVADIGSDLFHRTTRAFLACASCHPEGGEDGHTWRFELLGPRRTQSIAGGILATQPLHWDGDMTNFETLAMDVMGKRMGGSIGAQLSLENITKMGNFLDQLAAPPPPSLGDFAAATRGKVLFNDQEVGCASCHSGPKLTNNQSVDVGTGKAFQVPTLRGVGYRAPYLHDGCAATLQERFTKPCGGGDRHGKTSQLRADQIDDLVAYLQTL